MLFFDFSTPLPDAMTSCPCPSSSFWKTCQTTWRSFLDQQIQPYPQEHPIQEWTWAAHVLAVAWSCLEVSHFLSRSSDPSSSALWTPMLSQHWMTLARDETQKWMAEQSIDAPSWQWMVQPHLLQPPPSGFHPPLKTMPFDQALDLHQKNIQAWDTAFPWMKDMPGSVWNIDYASQFWDQGQWSDERRALLDSSQQTCHLVLQSGDPSSCAGRGWSPSMIHQKYWFSQARQWNSPIQEHTALDREHLWDLLVNQWVHVMHNSQHLCPDLSTLPHGFNGEHSDLFLKCLRVSLGDHRMALWKDLFDVESQP